VRISLPKKLVHNVKLVYNIEIRLITKIGCIIVLTPSKRSAILLLQIGEEEMMFLVLHQNADHPRI